MPAQGHYPRNISSKAHQSRLNFRNFDFSRFLRGPLAPKPRVLAKLLCLTIVLLTVNKRRKFQPPAAYRFWGYWTLKLLAENLVGKWAWKVWKTWTAEKIQWQTKVSTFWHNNRGPNSHKMSKFANGNSRNSGTNLYILNTLKCP